jgi:hypothetical protein
MGHVHDTSHVLVMRISSRAHASVPETGYPAQRGTPRGVQRRLRHATARETAQRRVRTKKKVKEVLAKVRGELNVAAYRSLDHERQQRPDPGDQRQRSTHVTDTAYRHVIVPEIRGGATVMDGVFYDDEDADEGNEEAKTG